MSNYSPNYLNCMDEIHKQLGSDVSSSIKQLNYLLETYHIAFSLLRDKIEGDIKGVQLTATGGVTISLKFSSVVDFTLVGKRPDSYKYPFQVQKVLTNVQPNQYLSNMNSMKVSHELQLMVADISRACYTNVLKMYIPETYEMELDL